MIDQTKPHIVVHLASQLCSGCGREHKWSCVYEAELRGRAKALRPIRSLPIGVPILTIRLPQQHVPACHECIEAIADRAAEAADAARLWSEAMRKKREDEALSASTAPSGAKSPTAEDLA